MPLIDNSGAVASILTDLGFNQEQKELDKLDTPSLMRAAGLSKAAILNELAHIMNNGSSESVKLQAIDKALKVAGLMDSGTVKPMVQVNINIKDPQAPVGVNPILLPREIQVNG